MLMLTPLNFMACNTLSRCSKRSVAPVAFAPLHHLQHPPLGGCTVVRCIGSEDSDSNKLEMGFRITHRPLDFILNAWVCESAR